MFKVSRGEQQQNACNLFNFNDKDSRTVWLIPLPTGLVQNVLTKIEQNQHVSSRLFYCLFIHFLFVFHALDSWRYGGMRGMELQGKVEEKDKRHAGKLSIGR